MQELYIEGLANHNDHESCADVSNDVREALTVAHTGRVLSPENPYIRAPTRSQAMEGNTVSIDKRDASRLCVV
ncbi:MAG: hypothetical protein ACREBW_07595 [Candidatus Micrarchaeaceae archaeon]